MVKWKQTYTGKRVNLEDPQPNQICIEDIAHALSNLCRFNGHVNQFYSVAQHSVLVADLLEDRLKIYGLLHDAHEAYIGDIISPVKQLIGLEEIKKLENQLDAAIHTGLGVKWPLSESDKFKIKKADIEALVMEKSTLLDHNMDWAMNLPDIDQKVYPKTRGVSKYIFSSLYERLIEKGD